MSTEGITNFTPRELELLAGALMCLKSGDIAVDYQKFAVYGKFKNANSAKASWAGLRKKLEKLSVNAPATGGNTTSTDGKRKKSSDEEDEATPKQKKTKGGKKAKLEPVVVAEDDEVEQEIAEDAGEQENAEDAGEHDAGEQSSSESKVEAWLQ